MMEPQRLWLFDELRYRYEHPLEIDAYARQVTGGLLAEERAVIEHASPKPCEVLTLGCGAGREAFALAKQGYTVTGADISQGMLQTAARIEKGRRSAVGPRPIHWLWMEDPLQIPLPDSSFSLVTAFAQLLSHIPNRAARITLLREVYRVLKPGALLVASFTDRDTAADLLDPEEAAPEDEGEESAGDAFLELERAAGWEDGDILVWNPSDAVLEEPLFFHLHTHEEIADELQSSGLVLQEILAPEDITPEAAEDAYRYPFLIAKRPVAG